MASMASVNIGGQQMQADLNDPITKFKLLVPRLKESLQKVMLQAAHVLNQNALMDSCTVRNPDVPVQKFDKCLEEFYAVCDQIEINLRLATEVITQNIDAQRHAPMMPTPQPVTQVTPQNFDTVGYGHYINQVRLQLASAQELHDVLVECARRIADKPTVQQPPS